MSSFSSAFVPSLVSGYNTGRSVGVSRDGRWITYTETPTEGDIWIATLR